jgi:hypothetical protein
MTYTIYQYSNILNIASVAIFIGYKDFKVRITVDSETYFEMTTHQEDIIILNFLISQTCLYIKENIVELKEEINLHTDI